MNTLVQSLLRTEKEEISNLQRINAALLQMYKISVGGYLTVLPKMVDIFYSNLESKPSFVDVNMQCMFDSRTTNKEIWPLQSNRFGKLYFHQQGYGGVDLCLSDSAGYCLCATLKAAVINGEEIWSQRRIKDRILEIICKHEGLLPDIPGKQQLIEKFNGPASPQVLVLREEPEQERGFVYNVPRSGIRRADKNSKAPLSSFIDLWNKKLMINNVQKIILYMEAHPDEKDVIKVLRERNFSYIPTGIRIRYGLGNKARIN